MVCSSTCWEATVKALFWYLPKCGRRIGFGIFCDVEMVTCKAHFDLGEATELVMLSVSIIHLFFLCKAKKSYEADFANLYT